MKKTNLEITFDTDIRNRFVKAPKWDETKKAYICQHCEGIVSASIMANGWNCPNCGMPIHEL